MEQEHPVGGLLTPKNLDELPCLGEAPSKFAAPRTVYCMDYFLPAKDQGDLPMCAAYASASFLENIMWRKNDVPQTVAPESIYKWAKEHDGMPSMDGTTLTAALDSLLAFKHFPENECKVKVLRNIKQVKYAIHKFGCCLLGLNISNEWYACNKNKTSIYGQKGTDQSLAGGHAVVSGGYEESGIYILNSWGEQWASYGRALLTWEELQRQFLYGAVIDNCLMNVHMN